MELDEILSYGRKMKISHQIQIILLKVFLQDCTSIMQLINPVLATFRFCARYNKYNQNIFKDPKKFFNVLGPKSIMEIQFRSF